MASLLISFFAISGLIISIASLGLGFLVFIKNRKSYLHVVFFAMTIAIALWSFGYWRWLSTDNYNSALLWARILSLGSTLIPVLHLHWILTLVGEAKKKKLILVFSYLVTMAFLGFGFSPLFVKSMGPVYGFLLWPEPGILYHFYVVVCYVGMMTYGLSRLFVGYRQSTGYRRQQIKYVFLGLTMAVIGGFSNFPLWYKINIPPYGNPFVLAYVIAYTYAIIKHRLMDIRLVIRQGTVYLLAFALVAGVAIATMAGFVKMAGEQVSQQLVLISILALLMALLVFNFVRLWLEKIANKYLFVSLYNYQEAIRSLGQQLTRTIDLDKIIDTIIKITADVMKLDKAGVLLRNEASGAYQIQKIVGFEEENGISLVKDNFLTEYLRQTAKPLVYEELRLQIRDAVDSELKQRLQNLRDNMKRIEAAICLPLFREAEIQGLIVLGNKISGDPYSTQDIGLLEVLAAQASMALNNALLYEDVKIQKQEVEKRKVDLERFYALTVGRELKMIELKDRLRQLETNVRQGN